jgi:SAM-dependent MidA family methyltransferase
MAPAILRHPRTFIGLTPADSLLQVAVVLKLTIVWRDTHHSKMTSLAETLHARMSEHGPITFAEFMEAALYDPVHGFYANPPVGKAGHFVTSPHVSPLFGEMLAVQIAEAYRLLGEPDPFHVIEWAAGDGTLAAAVTGALPDAMQQRPFRYLAVERGPGGREAIRRLGLEALDESEVPRGVTGIAFGNELLTAFPVHLLRRQGGHVIELYVDWAGRGFEYKDGPLSDPTLEPLAALIEEGAMGAVAPSLRTWLATMSEVLDRGYVLLFDYGADRPGPPRGYRHQRLVEDLLADPGSVDITADVVIPTFLDLARDAGWRAWPPVTQRDALLALGIAAPLERARAQLAVAADDRQGQDARAALWNGARLIDPAGPGNFDVLVLGRNVEKPLSCLESVAAARRGLLPAPMP